MTEEKVSKEFLLHLYDATWEDIRHSRMQEWKVLEVIALSFIALVGLGIQEAFRDVSIIFGIFIVIFAILGFFVTLRHRNLFADKMELIRNIETAMGLNTTDLLPTAWKKRKSIKILRIGSTSFFLMGIYIALALSALTYVLYAS